MLISVVIPCYNSQLTVGRAVDSVLEQTYRNIEIICVNDGSTDRTTEILRQYGNKVIIIDLPNGGASKARNKGLEIAKGEFIQFLDADDAILPEKISHQVQLIQSSGKRNISFVAASTYIDNGGHLIIKNPVNDLWTGLLLTKLGNTCANLFNKKTLTAVGNWNEELKSAQEYDLMFRLIKFNANIIIDTNPYTIIYKTSNSISSIKRSFDDHNFFRGYTQINQIADYLKSTGKWDENYKDLYYQKLFKLIQFLYNDYPDQAEKLMKSVIPNDFDPSTQLNSKKYVFLYNFIGFKRLHALKRNLRKLKI